MITSEQLDALVRRYAPAGDQKCVVCGAPLRFSSSGDRGSPPRYNCSSDDASLVNSTGKLRERLEHYEASAWYHLGQADSMVVELVQAYRELEPRAACPCFDASAEARLREAADAPSIYDMEVRMYCLAHRRRVCWLPLPGWWIHDKDMRLLDRLDGNPTDPRGCSAMWIAPAPRRDEGETDG